MDSLSTVRSLSKRCSFVLLFLFICVTMQIYYVDGHPENYRSNGATPPSALVERKASPSQFPRALN
jgi:hypothetical protein